MAKFFFLVAMTLLLIVTACGPTELTSAQLERQQLDAQRALEKLEAQRAKHALRLEFWRKVQPVLVVAAGGALLILLAGLAWAVYETIDVFSIRLRQTQVEPGKELAYFPRRDAVLMAQRLVRPLAILARGQEHAPEMAGDERMQTAVSLAQQVVAAKAVESPPTVVLQSLIDQAQLPAGTQSLRIVGPERLIPWVEDVRGQLAAGDVIEGQITEVGT